MHTEQIQTASSPSAKNASTATQGSAWLLPRPVIDRTMKIAGYELIASPAPGGNASPHANANEQMLAAIEDLVENWPFGERLVFMDAAAIAGNQAALAPLAEHKISLCCGSDEASLQLAGQLHQSGFGIVIDSTKAADSLMLPPFADYIRISPAGMPAPALEALAAAYRGNAFRRLIAVPATAEEFERCSALGVHLFQGDWYMRPGKRGTQKVEPLPTQVFTILNLVKEHADIREIEEALKLDAALSWKLLHYINSAGFGMEREIQSFRHAVTVLGYDNLQRWLTLLLIAGRDKESNPALVHAAVVRGRFTELLGKGRVGQTDLDNLFMVGVFSLIDVLLDTTRAEAIKPLNLPAPIREALLENKGAYAPFLGLAEACESGDFAKTAALARMIKVAPREVNAFRLEALAWANTLGI